MATHYRHRQVGWVTLGAVVAAALLVGILLPLSGAPAPVGVALGVLLVVGLLFSTLTVEVDESHVRVAFTGGLVRMRIPVASLRTSRAVRNPWYYGWGIHRYPGGWIWNVSGSYGVELELEDGRRYRVGTDEPDALVRAIAHVAPTGAGAHAPLGRAVPARRGPAAGIGAALAVLIGGALLTGGLFALFRYQMRDPQVAVTAEALSVDTPFYGERYPIAEITGVSLERQMPCVERRTNGFAASGVLRGWFDVCGLGRGKLFVDVGAPPFVLVRLRSGFAIVNFGDSARTQALYDQLKAVRGE